MTFISNDIRQQALEARKATLMREFTLTLQQIERTINEVDRDRLNRQAKSIYQEFEQVEQELIQINASGINQNRQYLNWDFHIPRINFKEAVSTAQEIILNCNDHCAALFLVQNSFQMGGKWCVTRIRDLLNETTLDLKHYPAEFTPSSQLNEIGLLDLLARYVNVEPILDNLDQYSQQIVQKICGSVQSGSIVFIEVRGWEFLYDHPRILRWFINSFWIPLVRELPDINRIYRKVKFIMIIVADEILPSECIPQSLSCSKEKFHVEKILELPLQNWSMDEIENWLGSYSRLKAQDINRLTKKVYGVSNGLPALVYDALSKHLSVEG